MATILITHGVPASAIERMEGQTVLRPEDGAAYTRGELVSLLPRAEIVLACGGMDAELIALAKRLKLIVCYGAGYEKIDLQAASERGVLVCNTPDSVTEATAEIAIALLLAVSRRVCELDRALRREGAGAFGMGRRMGESLAGGTLGVVGMGRIGGRVADFGRLMGMRVIYCARTEHERENIKGAERVPLERLLRESDAVSVHCPLTDETRGLISRERLSLMKPTAVLVNTARGQVIDEEALIEALQGGKLRGAGLDVYADEPHVPKALFSLENVVLTPHIGSNTLATREGMTRAAASRIAQFLRGETPDNVLNKL